MRNDEANSAPQIRGGSRRRTETVRRSEAVTEVREYFPTIGSCEGFALTTAITPTLDSRSSFSVRK